MRGFTLIELMVAITIMVIVSSIGYVTYHNAQVAARDGKRKIDLREIQPALELYYQRIGTFPATGSLGNLVPDYASSLPTDPVSGSSYEYHSSGIGYVLCTVLENTNDPDRPATMNASCAAGDNFFISYP